MLAPPARRTTSQFPLAQHSQSRRCQLGSLTVSARLLAGNDGKTWVEDGKGGARVLREVDGGVPAPGGYSLAQIMSQHHIQPVVPQRPGDLLGRDRIILVALQSPFNRR